MSCSHRTQTWRTAYGRHLDISVYIETGSPNGTRDRRNPPTNLATCDFTISFHIMSEKREKERQKIRRGFRKVFSKRQSLRK